MSVAGRISDSRGRRGTCDDDDDDGGGDDGDDDDVYLGGEMGEVGPSLYRWAMRSMRGETTAGTLVLCLE